MDDTNKRLARSEGMTAPEDSMDDRLTLQALREEMVFTRVLLGEQYATAIDAGAATREEITEHIFNCGRIAEHLSNNQTSAIADAAKVRVSQTPWPHRIRRSQHYPPARDRQPTHGMLVRTPTSARRVRQTELCRRRSAGA